MNTDLISDTVGPAKSLNELYALWKQLEDVPVTDDGGQLDDCFLHFEVGNDVLDVWGWFEKQNKNFVVGEVMQGIRRV